MFTSSPRYATLSRQVARAIAEKIRQGEFGASLPAERWLAQSMQVSRRTIRRALLLLRKEELLATIPGRETRIAQRPLRTTAVRTMQSVGLLLPEPVDRLEPYSTVFFDYLRALLSGNGIRLETHSGPSYFSRRPAAALAKLTARFPCDAWILAFSNRACQHWFHARAKAAVVVGTAHRGLDLPYVDIDMRAIARHAANHLHAKGHRRIGLVVPEKDRAGDRMTQEGFLEGVQTSAHAGTTGRVFCHDGTMTGLRRMTERILRLTDRPTALFIANPYHYMGVATLLAERGIRVPRDVSLLCRDDDYCLRYLPVEPGRYPCLPEKRAHAIYSTIMAIIQPGLVASGGAKSVLLLPKLVEGASVARLHV